MIQGLDNVFGLIQDGLPPPAANWYVYHTLAAHHTTPQTIAGT